MAIPLTMGIASCGEAGRWATSLQRDFSKEHLRAALIARSLSHLTLTTFPLSSMISSPAPSASHAALNSASPRGGFSPESRTKRPSGRSRQLLRNQGGDRDGLDGCRKGIRRDDLLRACSKYPIKRIAHHERMNARDNYPRWVVSP